MADYKSNHDYIYNYNQESMSPITYFNYLDFDGDTFTSTYFKHANRYSLNRNYDGIGGIMAAISGSVANIKKDSSNINDLSTIDGSNSTRNSSIYSGPVVVGYDSSNQFNYFYASIRPSTNKYITFFNAANDYTTLGGDSFNISGDSSSATVSVKFDSSLGLGISPSGLYVKYWSDIHNVCVKNVATAGYLYKNTDGSVSVQPNVAASTITVNNAIDASVYDLACVNSSDNGNCSLYRAKDASNSINAYFKGGNLYQTSDANLKDVVANLDVDPADIKSIDKVYFKWKSDKTEANNIGVIAQSVEKKFPELVTVRDGVKGVQYDKLAVVALAAIDKLTDQITELRSEIEQLKKERN